MHTILICDDDKDIVSALDIYLTSEGYATVKAYDGQECLRLAEREPVDLILLDVMMGHRQAAGGEQHPHHPPHRQK